MKVEVVERHGSGYYIVELEDPILKGQDLWYHEDFEDTDNWCEQTFGPQDIWGAEPVTGWKRMRDRYYFVGEDKLNLFVLRWS